MSIAHFYRLMATTVFVFAISAANAARSDEPPPTPDPQDLIDLVRATVLTVDAANKSGDYEPLRELGAKAFRDANDASRLAEHFRDLRASGIDMSPVAALTPQTSGAPRLDRNGLLRILGFFEMGKTQLVYDLLYAYEAADHASERRWKLAGLSIRPKAIAEQPKLMQPQ